MGRMLRKNKNKFSIDLRIFFNSFIYLFLAVLGLHCCIGFCLVAATGGSSLAAVHGLLVAVASLVAEHGLWGTWAQ